VGGATVTVFETEPAQVRPLNPRHDVRNHSPDGFQWGYGGSGPAQLALALLCDCLGDVERAQRHYQAFKFAVIVRLQGDHWALDAADITAWIETAEQRQGEGLPLLCTDRGRDAPYTLRAIRERPCALCGRPIGDAPYRHSGAGDTVAHESCCAAEED
jgi:hypothetical protein